MSLNIAPKQLAEDESRFVSKVGTTVFHDALVEFSKDPAEEMSSEEDEVGENQPMKPMSDSEDEAREKQPMKPMSDSEDEAREKQPMKPMSDSEDEAGEKQPVKPMPDSEDEVQSSAKDPAKRQSARSARAQHAQQANNKAFALRLIGQADLVTGFLVFAEWWKLVLAARNTRSQAHLQDSKQEAVRECGQLTGRMEEAKIHSSIRISKLEKEKQVLEERVKELEVQIAARPAQLQMPAAGGRNEASTAPEQQEGYTRDKDVYLRKELYSKDTGSHLSRKIFAGLKDENDNDPWPHIKKFHDSLKTVITAMSKRLVDRDEVVRLLVLAVVAKQHILLFGPPGTAKSYVAHLLSQFLYDTHEDFGGLYFEAQFHPSTTVEDIFGPTSLNDLRQGRIRRNVNSMLPYAAIAFLDEVFKAQPSLLSCLLSTLNERCFKNGSQMLKDLPLSTAVVASNEVPLEAGAGALMDRFLMRVLVDYVSADGPSAGDDVPLNRIMNSKFETSDRDIHPVFSLKDVDLLHKIAKKQMAHPADKCDTTWTWKKKCEYFLVLQNEAEAKRLLDEHFLEDRDGSVTVKKSAFNPKPADLQADATRGSDFQFQKLEAGWKLEGYKSCKKLREAVLPEKTAASADAQFPVFLRFSGGQEVRKIYDIVLEFVSHLRHLDALEEKQAASKRLSTEGGGRMSDRRSQQILGLMRIVAVTQQRNYLIIPDLYLMVYCCWKTRAEWEQLSKWWLLKIKAELRMATGSDKDKHNPKGHLWLSPSVIHELEQEFKGRRAEDDGAWKKLVLSQVFSDAKEKMLENKQALEEARKIREEQMRLQRVTEEEARKVERQKEEEKLAAAAKRVADQQQANEMLIRKSELMDMEQKAQREACNAQAKLLEKTKSHLKELAKTEQEMARRQAEVNAQQRQHLEANQRKIETDKKKYDNTVELSQLIKARNPQRDLPRVRALLSGDGNSSCAANINLMTSSSSGYGTGNTCFTWAVRHAQVEYLQEMLNPVHEPDLQWMDGSGDPPLCMARHVSDKKDRDEIISALCQAKCDVNQANGQNGNTLLHYMAKAGETSSCKILLESFKASASKKNNAGSTCKDLARGNSQMEGLFRNYK